MMLNIILVIAAKMLSVARAPFLTSTTAMTIYGTVTPESINNISDISCFLAYAMLTL